MPTTPSENSNSSASSSPMADHYCPQFEGLLGMDEPLEQTIKRHEDRMRALGYVLGRPSVEPTAPPRRENESGETKIETP